MTSELTPLLNILEAAEKHTVWQLLRDNITLAPTFTKDILYLIIVLLKTLQ